MKVILAFVFVIFALNAGHAYGQNLPILDLLPTDDTFVVTDLNDPGDPHKLQQMNTGDAGFLKVWYAWNVTESQEKISSVTYLKFDLSNIQADKVLNANLKITPISANEMMDVSLFASKDNAWSEEETTYLTKPALDSEPVTEKKIVSNISHGFEVTDLVKNNSGSEITFALTTFPVINSEKLVTFHSKESKEQANRPVLEIILDEGISEKPSQNISGQAIDSYILGVSVAVAGVIGFFLGLFVRNKRSPFQ